MQKLQLYGGGLPFPARAGMNRGLAKSGAKLAAVPRARGDEPIKGRRRGRVLCRSPRARG